MDRKIEKKTWTIKRIVIFSLVAALSSAVIYTLIFGDASSKLNVALEKTTISEVSEGPFQEFIPVTGNVMPIKTIYLDAIEGGRVEKIFVEEGSFVQTGNELLKLSNTRLQLDIINREAQLLEQINNLRNTRLAMEQNRLTLKAQLLDLDYQIQQQKRQYEQNVELMKQNLVSQTEFDQSREQYEYLVKRRAITIESQRQDSVMRVVQVKQLEGSVGLLQSNLNVIKQNLENLTLRAPISGQLTSLNAEIGESKAAGQRLGQIDVLDGFKLRVAIDEHYIARINIGQSGEFDFAGNTFGLTIKKVYPEVLNGRFEVDMHFESDEPDGIRRGQTMHIRLELGDLSDAILLPRGGFYQKTGGNWVYVVDPSGEFAVRRDIKIGRQNPQVFEVLSGLTPGDRVITSSYDYYGDIEKLILKEE